jgi:hypothetical protein
MSGIEFPKMASYNLERKTEMDLDFNSSHVEYVSFTDTNSSNQYTYGNIQYNAASLAQQSESHVYLPSEAYFIVPIQTTLSIANGTFTIDGTNVVPSNINVVPCEKK